MWDCVKGLTKDKTDDIRLRTALQKKQLYAFIFLTFSLLKRCGRLQTSTMLCFWLAGGFQQTTACSD